MSQGGRANPDSAPVPDQPAALFAVATGLARKLTPANAERGFRYLKRLPKEFEVCAVRDCSRITPVLQSTRAYTDWCVTNSKILT